MNIQKGRQIFCNLKQLNDIRNVDIVDETFDLTSSLINRLFQKGHKKAFVKCFASFETTNPLNQLKATNCKLHESHRSWPSLQHNPQTCRKNCQKKTCTTKQSHVENRNTSTTKTSTPNHNNYSEHWRKTYSSSNDDNHDCINNIDTNNTEWYIELASNCYRNGFQLHVNHLDECSKHPCIIQSKPAIASSFLRLPSSALVYRTSQPKRNIPSAGAVSLTPDLVLCSSLKSITLSAHKFDKNCANNTICDHKKSQSYRQYQLNSGEYNNHRIYSKNNLRQAKKLSTFNKNSHEPIDKNCNITTLPLIDTRPITRQLIQPEQFNVLNAKNNMNSVAVDANNLQQNLQLSCQTIQYNYQNNNSTIYQEFQADNQQEPQTIAENNNYKLHWIDESIQNPIALNDHEVKPKELSTTSNTDIVHELIDVFNRSLDVTDANQRKLPQIILSDFSSDKPTPPPTTPLFFTIQSANQTLSEYPTQLQEFQLN